LAVARSVWVAGLIKPAQRHMLAGERGCGQTTEVRVDANQRLSHDEEGKAYGRKAKTSNRTGETPPSGIIGGPRKT
jgi:hypothetical protein